MELLNQTLERIKELDWEAMRKSRNRLDNLIKPKGSLGRLEDIAEKLAGITGNIYPSVDNRAVIVMAADHGVYEEGVAPDPQMITAMQTCNFTKGITGIGALAKQAKTDVIVVDIGVAVDLEEPKIINRKIKYGTDNMAKGPAMTREEAIKSLEVGIEIATEEVKKGRKLLTTGEMGIGNTTPSAAIVCVLGGYDPYEIAGKGSGLCEERVIHKAEVVKRSISINKPDKTDGIDILSKVGGFEIGGMAGVMLAGAANRVPIVVDGFIATAAALIACIIEPKVRNYLFASHASMEKGAAKASELLGLKPMLNMEMRLGEGTGAVMTFNIIEAATFMNNEMATFEDIGMSRD